MDAVNRDLALLTAARWLREEFGRLLQVREARRVRRAAGECWAVTIAAVPTSGDVVVGQIEVDETGEIAPKLTADDVLKALQRPASVFERFPSLAPPPGSVTAIPAVSDELADFGDFGGESEDDGSDDPDAVRARVQALLSKGDAASWREARDLLPRLLGDPDRRGITLLRMAELERRLDAPKLAKDYAEAAAREFADRFDMIGLEKAAGLAMELQSKEDFLESQVHALLESCRARLVPMENLFEAPALRPVPEKDRRWLETQSRLRTLKPGETLVREGDPSRSLFVIKSGLVGVLLDKPTGGARMVRCCFPGWLLGESSVLVEGDPRCTASLRAQRVTEVWELDAQVVKDLMRQSPDLADAIAHTKQIHRLDSFFSMHETMGQLDVQVRDEMIGCIQRIQTFDEDTVIIPSGEVPSVCCLVARGEVALHSGWDIDRPPISVATADQFVCVRDAIHEIPVETSAVARAGATIAFFDAERLRALVAGSGDRVAAVLERLG
jgi:CRP-like cAMP-binding protein